jgi:hypothetical protein
MTSRVFVCMYGDLLSVNSPFIDDLTCSCAFITGTSGGQGGQFEGKYSGRSGYSFYCNVYFIIFILRLYYVHVCMYVCIVKSHDAPAVI